MWPKDGFGALHWVCTVRAVYLLGSRSAKRSNKELKIEGGGTLPRLITSWPCWHWQLTQKQLSMHVLWSWNGCTPSYIHIHLTLYLLYSKFLYPCISLTVSSPSISVTRSLSLFPFFPHLFACSQLESKGSFIFFWHPCPSAYWLATELVSPCRLLIESEVHQPFPSSDTHTHTH